MKDEIQQQVETLRNRVLALDMDKLHCDGSLYVLNNQPKQYTKRYEITPETSEWLKSPTFNNWEFEDNELVSLIMHMYENLGLPKQFDIDLQTLFNFVNTVRDHYNHNPFHNFKHAFCVTQMAYALIHKTGFVNDMTMLEKFILITACLGHDLDHPGYNNAYQVNAKTDLAIIYNDQSPLENHHCAMLFAILRLESCNLFKNIAQEHIAIIRKAIIRTIMATDMAKHGESLSAFNKIVGTFSFQEAEHRSQLLCILIKCADISTEVRPPSIAGISC
jgi:high affinity cGMP-specific 3',5'-cyclic phosphodiesterase 9